MSKITVVRYQTRPEYAEENQRLVQDGYAELATTDPGGPRCLTFRLADLALASGEVSPSTAVFAEFQRGIGDRVVAPTEVADAELVGSYGSYGHG